MWHRSQRFRGVATSVGVALALLTTTGDGSPVQATVACVSIEAPGEVVFRTLGRGSNPGDPPSAPENYSKLVDEFDRRPDAWGGAFVDGDTLVVNYLGARTDAWQTIEQLEIVEGVTLCPSTVSLTQLHEATEAMSDTMTYDAGVSGYGPRYSTSSIAVDVRDEGATTFVRSHAADLDVPLEIRVDPATPVPASRYGDSGGAVYLDVGSGSARAVGIISGSNNSGGGTLNCRSYYSPLQNLWFNAGTVDAS